MRKLYVPSVLTVLILTLVELVAFAANESPQTFTLDGQLYAGDRTSPLLDVAAKIKVQILDPSKNCILYEEEQPVDTTTSGGHFSIQVGSVVGSIKRKAMDAGNTMQKVYQNSSAIAASGVSCSGTYSPVMGAIRYVRVIVTPTSGSPNTLSPDMVMDAVPNAMVAQSVQGLERENILQTNPAILLTQLKLEQFFQSLTSGAGNGVKFDGTNFVAYDPSNGNNLSPSSVPDTAIGSVGWAKITSVPPALSTIAGLSCADGKILKMVSGAWACANESGVGSESDPTVSAFAKNAPGNGLIVNGSNQIIPDFGSTGGKVAQGNDPRFSDSRTPNGSASGDLSGSYPSPSVAKIQGRGVSVTAPADGQILRYNNGASQWEPYNFGIGDLKTSMGTSQFISASCTASETLIWSSVTNTFQCTTIALSGSQVTGNIAGSAANVTGTVGIANGGTGQTTAAAALNALLPSQSGANGKVLQSDGTNASWQTPAASGITSFNGSSQASQTLAAPGAAGTAPNWSTNAGTGTHTLNIPMASTASVTAGLLSKTDYDNFNSKLSSESDPKVGANTTNYLSKWNGSALVASGVLEISGNVGIGTISPTTKLDVNGTINATAMTINGVSVSAGGGDNLGNHTATQNINLGAFKLVGNGGSSGLAISSSGQVGVGVASPGEALQVNGAVKATGTSGTLMASSTVVDNIFGTTARLISVGPNASTAGGFEFNAASSDNSINTNPMVILPNGRVGIGTASPTTKLEVNGTINASAITVNGVPIVTSSGVTSLNGSSQGSQSLAAPGVTGTAPNWVTNTGTGVHTLNIPMASTASVTAGLISKTDYDNFSSKLGTGSSLSGDVTGTPSTTSVDKIKGIAVSAAPTLAGQVLRYTGSQFTPAFVSMSDLRSQTTGTTALATSCAANQTLTYNSVGDNLTCSNISLPAGQVTGTLGISNGGTGQTTANAALNALLPSQSSQGTKFLQTDGSNTSWASVPFTETDPKIGANTTNYFSKWNGSALVASGVIESGGNIGIGTTTPGSALTVGGTIESKSGGIKFPDGSVQVTAATGGSLSLQKYAAAPTVCNASSDAQVALTTRYTMCVCKDGVGWVSTSDGSSTCIWSGLVFNISPAVAGKTTWSLQVDGPLILPAQGVWTITLLSSGNATFKMWGGGGAGTDYSSGTHAVGGGGGFAGGTISLVGGTQYVIRVGQGGNFSGTRAGGGGGVGGGSVKAGGGGYSGIFSGASEVQGSALLLAGGGGAGGGGGSTYTGGAGGGSSGAAGGTSMSGGGGSQVAGGVAGVGGQASGSPGSALLGGNGSSWGEGGGGGYFGGGGGGHAASNTGGGGGGSGFAAGTVASAVLTTGSASTPGNSADGDRGSSGDGGAYNTVGNDGRLIIAP